MRFDEQELLEHYPRWSGVHLSMVTNSLLETAGRSGSSSDVTNPLDRVLLMHLRKNSDLVITDVATAIAESYKPSRLVDIEIWSKSGDFRGLSNAEGHLKRFSLVQVDDIQARIQELRQSHESILLETGPNLTRQLADEGEIDSASLTITESNSESQAIACLEPLKRELGLDRLPVEGVSWVQGTLFARLSAKIGVA